jgi:hypothetical protein
VLDLYRRLPEEVRRCLRPLNLVDELASFLPPSLGARTTTATEMLRRLVRLPRLRHPLRRLEGRERHAGGPLVCVVAADDVATRWWARTLFSTEPTEELLGIVRPGAAPAATAAAGADADVTICQATWPLTPADAAVVPSSVPLWLDTSRPLDAIVQGDRRGRGSRKDDARRVRRLSLRVRFARGARAVERFRRELYEPYARQRFGDLFLRVPAHAFRHAERRGWLLLLEDGERTVAGAMLERWGRERRILAFGVALEGPIPSGLLLEACYYHAIRFATEAGFPRLSLGTARPTLADGVLRYKRKWGASLGRPNTWEVFALRYRNSAGIRAALAAAPLVIDRGPDGLAALVGAPGDNPSDVIERVETPGLREIALLVDHTPVVLAPPDPRIRIVPPGAVWPPNAALPGAPTAIEELAPSGITVSAATRGD